MSKLLSEAQGSEAPVADGGRAARTAFATCLLVCLVVALPAGEFPRLDADAEAGRLIAQGRLDEVPKPFANRLLHPLLAGLLARSGVTDIDGAFVFLALVALVILAGAVVTLAAESGVQPYVVVVLAAGPYLISTFEQAYLADLFHAAGLAILLLCLRHDRLGLGLLVLAALVTVRESTVLFGAVLVLLAWRRGQRTFGSLAGGSTLLGLGVVAFLSRHSLPNIHNLPDWLYMMLKVPFNVAKNLFGVVPWANTLGYAAAWHIQLPGWARVGSVTEVGLAPWDPVRPLMTLCLYLTLFGVAPTALVFVMRVWHSKSREDASRPRLPLVIECAVIYGTVAFVIGPALGDWVSRLIGYGWPAFWIGVPALGARALRVSRERLLLLLVLQQVATWSGWVALNLFRSATPGLALTFALAIVMHVLTWRTLVSAQQTHGWARGENGPVR